MFIFSFFTQAIRYMIEGFFEIFGSSHDDYPAIGVQPFTGNIPLERRA